MSNNYQAGDFVIVKYGGPNYCAAGHGKQMAVLLEKRRRRYFTSERMWFIRKWLKKSQRWTYPMLVLESEIIGKAATSQKPPLPVPQ